MKYCFLKETVRISGRILTLSLASANPIYFIVVRCKASHSSLLLCCCCPGSCNECGLPNVLSTSLTMFATSPLRNQTSSLRISHTQVFFISYECAILRSHWFLYYLLKKCASHLAKQTYPSGSPLFSILIKAQN